MAHADLRSFLEKLEREGQLIRIKEEVLPEPDISAAAYAASKITGGPAVLFEKIVGYEKKNVTMNIHGSWENYALMLDLPKKTSVKELSNEIEARMEHFPVRSKVVTSGPAKEVIVHEDINLFNELPLFRVNEYDGGFYISKGVVISQDPEEATNQNLGMYRIQVKDKDRLGIQVAAHHDMSMHLRKAEEFNQPLPVAISIGNDPVVSLVAAMPLEYEEDEYEMAGALRKEGVDVVRAETSDLMVPANAEIIIEGEVIPRWRSVEGPFGEYTGFYSSTMRQTEVQVKAVTRRKDPIIFENLYIGKPWTELDMFLGPITSVVVGKQLKAMAPEVVAVNANYCHGLGVVISTRSRLAGYGKIVPAKLLATPHGLLYPKLIIVVDDDIDPFDLNEVMWALLTRFRAERDLILIPNAPGSTLDPASVDRGLITRMILDATKPVPPDPPLLGVSVVKPPEEARGWIEKLERLMRKED